MKVVSYFSLGTTTKSKWINNFNARQQSKKFLEESIKKNMLGYWNGQGFFEQDPSA
jgi:hypothetical protein